MKRKPREFFTAHKTACPKCKAPLYLVEWDSKRSVLSLVFKVPPRRGRGGKRVDR